MSRRHGVNDRQRHFSGAIFVRPKFSRENGSEMPEYRVTWQIDVVALSPKDAAERALEIQRNPDSIATVFDVTLMPESFDLLEEKESPADANS